MSDDLPRFKAAFSYVIEAIKRFQKSLTPRELVVLQIGMRASHIEEAIARGETERAKGHLAELSKLVNML